MCSHAEQRLNWTKHNCCWTKSVIGKVLLVIARKQHSEIPDLNQRQRLSVYRINTQTRIKTPPPSKIFGWRQGGAVIRRTVFKVAGSSWVSADSYPWTSLHMYIHSALEATHYILAKKRRVEGRKVGKVKGEENRQQQRQVYLKCYRRKKINPTCQRPCSRRVTQGEDEGVWRARREMEGASKLLCILLNNWCVKKFKFPPSLWIHHSDALHAAFTLCRWYPRYLYIFMLIIH